MQKNWSTYRITLLFYLGALMLPLGFYSTYTSFQNLQNSTQIVVKLHENSADIKQTQIDKKSSAHNLLIREVESRFKQMQPWFLQNSDSIFYVGGEESLLKEYTDLLVQWDILKRELGSTSNQDTVKTFNKRLNSLIYVVEKMVGLSESKVYNYLFVTAVAMMMLMLLLTYFVRIYIEHQIMKHAIYDRKTNLFNKRYFLTQLKISCARSVRYEHPLSVESFSVVQLEAYDKKIQEHILKRFGALVNSVVRDSDVACHYDGNQFLILLPDTEKDAALVFEERLSQTIEKYDFDVTPKPEFRFEVLRFDEKKETVEIFISRALH